MLAARCLTPTPQKIPSGEKYQDRAPQMDDAKADELIAAIKELTQAFQLFSITRPAVDETAEMLQEALRREPDNEFFNSLLAYYAKNGKLTEPQLKQLRRGLGKDK